MSAGPVRWGATWLPSPPETGKAGKVCWGIIDRNYWDGLIDQGDTLDSAGTRIWAVAETLAKAGGRSDAALEIVSKKDQAVLLAGGDAGGISIQILTLAIRLTWGAPQILAVTVCGTSRAAGSGAPVDRGLSGV